MSDLNFQAHLTESDRLRTQIKDLEDKAGVAEAHEQFNEANSKSDLRVLYFSVRDKKIRKELIENYRNFQQHADQYTPSRQQDAERDLRILELKGFISPWVWPSAIVVGSVWIGWSFAAITGALAGAFVAFFAGNSYISDRLNAHLREVFIAKEDVDELSKDREREALFLKHEMLFSSNEEQSGAADEGPQPEPNLHWFSRAGWDSMVSNEIAKGADVESENNEAWGSRPLHRAAASGNADVVKLLIEAGSNPNATNRLHSFTPLHSAAGAGSAECIELLLVAGASKDAVDRYGHLPIYRAIQSSEADAVRAFLDAGSPIETPVDAYGSHPLHIAARLGHAKVVELLLKRGADASAKNNHNESPLDSAIHGKGSTFERVRELIKQAGGMSGSQNSQAA